MVQVLTVRQQCGVNVLQHRSQRSEREVGVAAVAARDTAAASTLGLAAAPPSRVAYLSRAPLQPLVSSPATYEIIRLCTSSHKNACCDLYICLDN